MALKQLEVEDDKYEVVAKPLKAPASRGELIVMLAIGLAGVLVSAALAVYVGMIGAPPYWLYVAATALVLAGVSLILATYSYFRRVEFLATAEALSVELELMSRRFNREPVGPEYIHRLSELLPMARIYAQGLLASGTRNAGRGLLEAVSSVDLDIPSSRELAHPDRDRREPGNGGVVGHEPD